MTYKVVVVSRNPQSRNADAVGRDLETALVHLHEQGFELLALTPVTGDDGVTVGVLITARSGD